jgi:hypothetical protein
LTCRGTGEVLGSPGNMLACLLARTKFVAGHDVPYPASVGPVNASNDPLGPSARRSVADGLPLLAGAIRDAPGPVGLCGYSLGALLVSRFLELKALGQYQDCRIAWVALVANPARAAGESIDPGPVGYGIEGAHGPWPTDIPVWTAANPRDGITSTPDDSPLRALAAGLDGLSFATLSWAPALAQRLIDGKWPTADYTPEELVQAGRLIYGYLLGGAHTSEYLAGGYLDRLADRIDAA